MTIPSMNGYTPEELMAELQRLSQEQEMELVKKVTTDEWDDSGCSIDDEEWGTDAWDSSDC